VLIPRNPEGGRGYNTHPLAALAAMASYYFIERLFLRLRKHFRWQVKAGVESAPPGRGCEDSAVGREEAAT